MADRLILIGPVRAPDGVPATVCPAIELNAINADALREGGVIDVRISQYSGELANATVLELSKRYIAEHGNDEWAAWEALDGFLAHMHGVHRIIPGIRIPFKLWNGGRRTVKDGKLIPEPGDLAMLTSPIKLDSRKKTLPVGLNCLIDGVSDDGEFVTIRWMEPDGNGTGTPSTHVMAVGANELVVK